MMSEDYPIERHPLTPFIPDGAKILMLGSFPPAKKRWSMDFYYPNISNDMWRIFGIIFHDDKFHFINVSNKKFKKEDIIECLKLHKIAIYDTACAICRTKNTASDKDLEIIEATDLNKLLDYIPTCTAVMTTGQKATDTFANQFNIKEPKVGSYTNFKFKEREIRLYRMPSSSRAYPLKIETKAEYYREMFNEILNK
jgi:hypoxanthine-DNA glycosylase